MKKNLTEVVFILDASGSMADMTSDTIGGFNSMLEKQRKEEGECLVSTVTFNDSSSVLHDRVPINRIERLTGKDYQAYGCTALIDAMGDAIKHIKDVHKYIRSEDVPEHTIFIITTDGYENASHKYSSNDVKRMVEAQKEAGWEFIFLGANIDAVETAKYYGIGKDRTANYINDDRGVKKNFDAVSKVMSCVRAYDEVPEDWSSEIDADYESRN